MPQFSIITVCLNNKSGLIETIKSIINQDCKDFELIIIDGDSVDGTKEVLKEYSSDITCWVSEKDTGIYNAMNKGIKIANGKYCLFLNSGDTLVSKNTLSEIYSKIDNSDIIYGNLIRKKGPNKYRITKYPKKLMAYHFVANVDSIHQQAAIIKTELFSHIGYFSEHYKIISDWEFLFKAVIMKNCSTNYVDVNFAIFDSSGISFNNSSEQQRKMEVLKQNLPEKILGDINELEYYRRNVISRIKMRLSKFQNIYKSVRIIYLPFIRVIERINYAIISKKW